MEKYINKDNIYDFAFINEDTLKMPIKAICVRFHGLGWIGKITTSPKRDEYLGERGIVSIFPYYNPWGWMNPETVSIADDLVDAVRDKFSLGDDIPLVSEGGSMGGLGSIMYCKFTKNSPICCASDSPVCDLYGGLDSFYSDAKNTIYSAYFNCEGTLEEATRDHSPLQNCEILPRIPYYVVCGDLDKLVKMEENAIPFVKKMKECGHNIQLKIISNYDHCRLDDFDDEHIKYVNFIEECVDNYRKK